MAVVSRGGPITPAVVASCLATAELAHELLDTPGGRLAAARAFLDGDAECRRALHRADSGLEVEHRRALGSAIADLMADARMVDGEAVAALKAIDGLLFTAWAASLADHVARIDGLHRNMSVPVRMVILRQLQGGGALGEPALARLLEMPESALGSIVVDRALHPTIKARAIRPHLHTADGHEAARRLLALDPLVIRDFADSGSDGATLASLVRGIEWSGAAAAAMAVVHAGLSTTVTAEVVLAAADVIPRSEQVGSLWLRS